MGVARAVVALVVLTLLLGCTSATPVVSPAASSSAPVPSSAAALPPAGAPPTWPSDTSYGRLLSQVQPDGSVSKDLALEAFSTVIAPLPGIPAATGAAPTDFEQADGTFAINWLNQYRDQLTPDQAAVVNQVLAPSTGDPVAAAGPLADVSGLGPAVAADDRLTPYQAAIDSAKSTIESRLHRTLQEGIFFGFSPPPSELPRALAYAFPAIAANGSPSCEVRATNLLTDSGSSQTRINVAMAHEVFHCFQFDAVRAAGGGKVPDWIMEGQAEWAGEDVAGPGPDGADWWGAYLGSPQIPLFQRTYDAVGFYEHLAETGTSPWSVFDAMLAATTDSTAAFNATGAQDANFLDTGRRACHAPTT